MGGVVCQFLCILSRCNRADGSWWQNKRQACFSGKRQKRGSYCEWSRTMRRQAIIVEAQMTSLDARWHRKTMLLMPALWAIWEIRPFRRWASIVPNANTGRRSFHLWMKRKCPAVRCGGSFMFLNREIRNDDEEKEERRGLRRGPWGLLSTHGQMSTSPWRAENPPSPLSHSNRAICLRLPRVNTRCIATHQPLLETHSPLVDTINSNKTIKNCFLGGIVKSCISLSSWSFTQNSTLRHLWQNFSSVAPLLSAGRPRGKENSLQLDIYNA